MNLLSLRVRNHMHYSLAKVLLNEHEAVLLVKNVTRFFNIKLRASEMFW
jgi:hypothetical protein